MTEPMSVDEALEVALGAISWWRSDGDPNEDVGDLEGATATLTALRARLAEQREELRRVREEMARVSFHGGVEPDHQIVAAWKRVVNRWLAALDRVIGDDAKP